MNAAYSSAPPDSNLQAVLAVLRPLATWLLRSGVGHAEFARACKQVFFEAALHEQQRVGQKDTDSALSLLAGMHRKDIRGLRASQGREKASGAAAGRAPSLANQVVARWLSLRWPMAIAFSSARRKRTFENLVRAMSRDVHPRTVFNELQRLGVVQETPEGDIVLQHTSFVPNADTLAAREIFQANVVDHIAAGVHNLTTPERGTYLEQSVFADGLTPESVSELQTLANALWRTVLSQTVQAATPLCAADAAQAAQHRIRLGMFFYSTQETETAAGETSS